MQRSFFSFWMVGVGVAHLSMAPAAHAEIYKWVDEDGRTHYSESKEAAGAARAEQLKLGSKPSPAHDAGSEVQHSQDLRIKLEDQDQIRKKAEQAQKEMSERTAAEKPPRSLSGGRSDGTDASRCALARDVLNGAVKHTNGTVTDTYDIKVAKNDVRKYCH